MRCLDMLICMVEVELSETGYSWWLITLVKEVPTPFQKQRFMSQKPEALAFLISTM